VRRSLLPALLLAVSLVACASREVPIAPEPDRLLTMAETATPPSPSSPSPSSPPARPQGAGAGGPEVSLPRAGNGVLPPGAADKVLPVGGQPIVKLLDAGAEPRGDLSYALSKGASQKMAMAMDMAVTIKAKGQSAPQMPMPRMSMTFDTTVADKNPAGELKIDSRLSATSVDPSGGQQEQIARALRPQIEALRGLGMVYWVGPKGHVHDVKVDVPAGVPPTAQQLLSGMSQSFESMVTPLPQEPVGVGGRWQVVSRLATGGADLLQSAVYTLKARSGARATLDVAIVQLSASDTLHTAQMPAGMSVKVRSFSSTGSGATQVDLNSVVPESGTMALTTGMEITVQGAAGADEASTVETSTTVQVARP
jgi:hypothetical protein